MWRIIVERIFIRAAESYRECFDDLVYSTKDERKLIVEVGNYQM